MSANPPIGEALRRRRWFHATSSNAAGESILRSGEIRASDPKNQNLMSPMKGFTYASSSLETAAIYALGGVMMGHDPWKIKAGDEHGWIFEVDLTSAAEAVPDEDEVGGLLHDCLRGKCSAPWLLSLAQRHVAASRLARVKEGEYAYYASVGKQLLSRMSDIEKTQAMLLSKNIAVKGNLRFSATYRLDKTRSKEVSKDGSNLLEVARRMDVSAAAAQNPGVAQNPPIDFAEVNPQRRYLELNRKYFGGRLPENLPIKLKPLKGVSGRCAARVIALMPHTISGLKITGRFEKLTPNQVRVLLTGIELSSLMRYDEADFDGILLHEMCHASVMTSGWPFEDHGRNFLEEARRVTAASGVKIPLSHDTRGAEVTVQKRTGVVVDERGPDSTYYLFDPKALEAFKAKASDDCVMFDRTRVMVVTSGVWAHSVVKKKPEKYGARRWRLSADVARDIAGAEVVAEFHGKQVREERLQRRSLKDRVSANPVGPPPDGLTFEVRDHGQSFEVQAKIPRKRFQSVGAIALEMYEDDLFHVAGLDVEPAYQRMGIATMLYEEAVKEARRRGGSIMSTPTSRSNEAEGLHKALRSKLKHRRGEYGGREVDFYENPPDQKLSYHAWFEDDMLHVQAIEDGVSKLGAPAGYLGLHRVGGSEEYEVDDLRVHPRNRKQGVAIRMYLEAAKAIEKEYGKGWITSDRNSRNDMSDGLHEALPKYMKHYTERHGQKDVYPVGPQE